MLVSHKYKFIYTKTYKTAGTSVESFFEKFCMKEGEWEESHSRAEYESEAGIIGFRGVDVPENASWWNHMPAVLIKKQLGERIWNSYFKFCVIRNPFEKCISAFEDVRHAKIKKMNRNFSNNFFSSKDEKLEFLNYLKTSPPLDRNKYLIEGEFCLDDLIRYESLNKEILRICKRLGLPYEPKLIPKFKQNRRRKEATFENLYSIESIQEVAKIFNYEIENFSYLLPKN